MSRLPSEVALAKEHGLAVKPRWNMPILDPNKRGRYVNRFFRIGATAIALAAATAAVAVGPVHLGKDAVREGRAVAGLSPSNPNNGTKLTPAELGSLTKVYVDAPPLNTVASIATAEGQAVSGSPDKFLEAEQQIQAQLHDDDPNSLKFGDRIRLPGNSVIGVPMNKPADH